MTGWFEIGVFYSKTEFNIGTLMRSALQLGAAGVFTIGRRYKRQASDTLNTAGQIPLRHYVDLDDFLCHRPVDAILIGVEMGGAPLRSFTHPKRAIYLLGAEDNGLSKDATSACQSIVSLESLRTPSYNVAVAGSIVMYDRAFHNPKGE